MTLHKLNILVAMQHQLLPDATLRFAKQIAPEFSLAEGFCVFKDIIYTLESPVVLRPIVACSPFGARGGEEKWG